MKRLWKEVGILCPAADLIVFLLLTCVFHKQTSKKRSVPKKTQSVYFPLCSRFVMSCGRVCLNSKCFSVSYYQK